MFRGKVILPSLLGLALILSLVSTLKLADGVLISSVYTFTAILLVPLSTAIHPVPVLIAATERTWSKPSASALGAAP